MTTTTKRLTRDETRRLAKLRRRLTRELEDLKLAGLEERAAKVREERDTVTAKLETAKTARQEAESARREEKRRRETARAACEKANEEAKAEAVAFLEGLTLPAEVDAVLEAAEEVGIERRFLVEAAFALELRTLGRLKNGTRTTVDRTKPLSWGHAGRWTHLLDAGPPRLPERRPTVPPNVA